MTADTIITRGLMPDCPNNVGIMNVAKCRRGEPNTTSYSIRLNNGRFITDLPKDMYEHLKQQTDKVFYTEGDINLMKQQYAQQENAIKLNLGVKFAQAASQVNTPPSKPQYQKTPFNSK